MRTKTTIMVLGLVLFTNLFLYAQEITNPVEFERISERVLIVKTGKVYADQIVAIATQKGIVVIDAGLSASRTKEYRSIIEREFNRNDFIYVINTHHHYDHVGGNQVFAGTNIISHERVPAVMKQFNQGLNNFVNFQQKSTYSANQGGA